MAIIWGILRLFTNPLLYLSILIVLMHGYFRIKRERRSFHTRVQDLYDELKFTFSRGLVTGLVLSAAAVALGIALPYGSIVLLAIVMTVIGLTFQLRFMSAAYTIGLTFIAVVLLNHFGGTSVQNVFKELQSTRLSLLAILLGLTLAAEGYLIFKSGYLRTSPNVISSSRGLPIGNHIANRTWMLPLFLLIPGGPLQAIIPWWPVFDFGGQSFTLILLPFFTGFHQRVQGSLPKESIQITAKRITWLGAIIFAIALISIWWEPLSYFAVIAAIVCRELLSIRQRMNDDSASFYFSKRDHGLMILGVLPGSPADKIGLEVGELIMKTNGTSVNTVDEFYRALQKNRAFCKLELVSLNGEIRFAQRALYEGEHHELGILFVEDAKKKGKHEAV